MIKFDLHIHSVASRYKEGKGIVDNSTIDNINNLLEKLDELEVGLFSITDHNRFYVELYHELDVEIKSGHYKNIRGLVAGVEFDVKMDMQMASCHIITIFNAQNEIANYSKIKETIDQYKLESKTDSYSREMFERILKEIGLDVILIACQRSGLDRHEGKHNSLSESTMDSEDLIMTGYINALEFQRPNVEGILRNNLKTVPRNVMLVMGSDCHDWSVYPNHDKTNGNSQFAHSRAKILPSFKGLLMAVTSPETRINQQVSKNSSYIKSFMIEDKKIPLVNGIIAIIGENGSGKSTLLKLLGNKAGSPKYVKEIVIHNKLICEAIDPSKLLFIEQGAIIKRFDNNDLFPKENFMPIVHDRFKDIYNTFASGIMNYIKTRIKIKDAIEQLSTMNLEYSELINSSTYFIHVDTEPNYANISNRHKVHKEELVDLIEKLNAIQEDDYYKQYKHQLSEVIRILEPILKDVITLFNIVEIEKRTKNTIVSSLNTYNRKIDMAATSKENDQIDLLRHRENFIFHIVDAIRQHSKNNIFPDNPIIVDGSSKVPDCGFSFNSEANYHGKNVLNVFLSKMFTQNYSNIESLKKITDTQSLINAIKGCTCNEQVEEVYENNLNSFFNEMCTCRNYIVDISQGEESLGNTLGELSLAYLKYITENKKEDGAFLIDQPEDHISNNNISKKLITYFNSVRNKKQIIIVTHNPLLVVNQDVDQVIFVNKFNDKIKIISGCLEYENDSINILELIAENMDGGKASIEKRLKVYG